MFAAIYCWKIKPGYEAQFEEGWHRATEMYRTRGSFGSCLHKTQDGGYLAYARWPNQATRDAAFAQPPTDPEAGRMMKEATESSEPEILLEITDDLLKIIPDLSE